MAAVAPTGKTTPSISFLAWNVESGGSDPQIIALQLEDFQSEDVVCLSEVDPPNFDLFKSSMRPTFTAINGRTGRADSLQILYNTEKFDELQSEELDSYRDYTLN